MAQTGFTPIQLYSSSTPTNAPSAGNLTNDTKGSELAINIADKNLFFKDSTNAVNTVPIRQSGAASDGWLSSTDWNTFNNKQPAGTYVTSVGATAPVASSGGTTPTISMPAATTSADGYLTSTDWNTFNGKQAALVSGTNIKTVSGTTLLGSGDLGTIGTGYGGTGLTSFTANGVVYASSTSALATGSALTFDGSNLGIGTSSPTAKLQVSRSGGSAGSANLVYVDVTSSYGGISVNSTANNNTFIELLEAGTKVAGLNADTTADITSIQAANGHVLAFNVNNTTEVGRFDTSGNLLVGTTSGSDKFVCSQSAAAAAGLLINASGNANAQGLNIWHKNTTGDNVFQQFYTEASATLRGSITYNRAGGLTAYNTTSDYRAKNVKNSIENALLKISALKPCTGRMNGAEQDIDFFVAHELQEVVPSAVTGEKDAVNENGTPKYQMVDKSALIPLLTAAIQEQQTIITDLKTEIDLLKSEVTKLKGI